MRSSFLKSGERSKKMKKRVISLVLALALCLGLAPWLGGGAQAATSPNPLYGTVAHYGFCGIAFVVNSKHELWAYRSDGTKIVNPALLMSNVSQFCQHDSSLAVLKTDGTLWLAMFKPMTPVCAIEGEFQLTDNVKKLTMTRKDDIFLYLKEDGSLYQGLTFSSDDEAQVKSALVAKDVVDVAGECYVTADGTVMSQTFEKEYDTQKEGPGLSFYYWIERSEPTAVQGLPPVSRIESIANAYFAIDAEGGLWTWGRNNCGQLGNGGIYDKRPRDHFLFSPSERSFWQNTYIENTVPTKVMDQVVDVFGTDDYHYDDGEDLGDANRWCTMYARTADGVLWQWADGGGARQYISYENGGYILKNNNITLPDAMYLKPRVAPDQNIAYVSDSVRVYQDGRVTASGFRALVDGDDVELYLDMTRSSYTTEQLVCNRGQSAGPVQPPTPAPTPNASGFVDVPENAYYYDPVIWAVNHKITTGTGATTFTPGKDCTVAEILTFLYRACGEPSVSGGNPFSAVQETDYYYKAAKWAREGGVIGMDFDPGAPCSRAQAVYFIWWACGRENASPNTPFTDVNASAHYAQAVSWALANGVTTGTTNTTFSPEGICTRGEIVTFLHRALAE